MKLCFLTVLLMICVTSCNTYKIEGVQQKINKSQRVELGSIVTESSASFFNLNTTTKGKPFLKNGVPVSVYKNNFSSNKLKKILKASKNVHLGDTLSIQKKEKVFITLEVKDQIKILDYLQSPSNLEIFNFLKSNPKAHLITSISALVPKEIFQALEQSELLLLKISEKGSSSLVVTSANERKFIPLGKDFNQLAFQSKYFCWGVSNKNKLVLKDLVAHKCDCSKGTSTKASKITKNTYNVKL